MQYAARLTTLPSPKSIAAPLAALALGAAVATGAYALIDDGSVVQEPAKVIVVDAPAPGQGVSAKNEAATAAAVGVTSATQGLAAKDEAATAAAVGVAPASEGTVVKDESATAAAVGSASSDIELRGSKASGTTSDDGATALPTDPHGVAATTP